MGFINQLITGGHHPASHHHFYAMKTIPSHGSCFMAKVSHMIYTWCSASPLAARYGLWRRADFWCGRADTIGGDAFDARLWQPGLAKDWVYLLVMMVI